MTSDYEKAKREIKEAWRRRQERLGRPSGKPADRESPFCSFCGKGRNEVDVLLEGPGVFICNECVAVCHDVIRKRDADE